jgi:hypothetical protein
VRKISIGTISGRNQVDSVQAAKSDVRTESVCTVVELSASFNDLAFNKCVGWLFGAADANVIWPIRIYRQ